MELSTSAPFSATFITILSPVLGCEQATNIEHKIEIDSSCFI